MANLPRLKWHLNYGMKDLEKHLVMEYPLYLYKMTNVIHFADKIWLSKLLSDIVCKFK